MKNAPSFKQEITAVFGKPVAENPTQVMIEAAYRHHGLAWRYLTLEVDPADLGDAVRGAKALGFAGFNCTIPHKVSVIPFLDEIAESARLMGAVNCVVRKGKKLVGENTDGKGFLKSLRETIDPRGKTVILFGAGGAARAIGVELGLAGAAHLTVVNRGKERGRELASLLGERTKVKADYQEWAGRFRVPAETDVVINATSIGLFPDVDAELPIDLASLQPRMVVADVIPNPPRTRLIRSAEQKGCRVIDGLGMLVNQGVIGVKYWTGLDPDPSVMRAALEEVFGK
ncbi:MAG TPA: shikimate dehydrogenase [Spirochaetia bacterium]|nr:shikimate dehydrogenase [Spirochaetia bacterium]